MPVFINETWSATSRRVAPTRIFKSRPRRLQEPFGDRTGRRRSGGRRGTGERLGMEVKASAKFQRYSPRKARLVTDLITASRPLRRSRSREPWQGSALPIGRVVRSAVANAENNFNLTMENLYVKKATADEGPRMKRVWYRGRGRRDMKLRRTSHITIVVDEREGAR